MKNVKFRKNFSSRVVYILDDIGNDSIHAISSYPFTLHSFKLNEEKVKQTLLAEILPRSYSASPNYVTLLPLQQKLLYIDSKVNILNPRYRLY